MEGTTTFQWYIANKADGNINKINGATGKTYTVANGDKDKYIYFEVTPRAITGELIGDSVMSANVHIEN